MAEPISRGILLAPTLSLFASTSTLLCCALPALLVTIGAGAVMAGLATNVPGYIWLTERKVPLFFCQVFCLHLRPLCGGGLATRLVPSILWPRKPASACVERAASFFICRSQFMQLEDFSRSLLLIYFSKESPRKDLVRYDLLGSIRDRTVTV